MTSRYALPFIALLAAPFMAAQTAPNTTPCSAARF